jgi:hypothetical protein
VEARQAMEIERDDALRGLDIFNDQLNDIYQESVRGKRKERNLLHSLFNCLASTGVGFSVGHVSKKGSQIGAKELEEARKSINTLIEQKNNSKKKEMSGKVNV